MMLEAIRKAKESEKEIKSLKECTFTPVKIADDSKYKNMHIDRNVYERNRRWELERQNKIDMVRLAKEQEEEPCSFKPTFLNGRTGSTKEYPRELRESNFIQEGLARHYHRMDKARSKSPAKPKTAANTASRRSSSRRPSVSGSQLHIDERYEQRKSVETKRHKLVEAVKQKYMRRRVQLHDQLMSMSTLK